MLAIVLYLPCKDMVLRVFLQKSSSVCWSFVSIYRNKRALWSKSKTWNELKSGRRTYFGQCPPPPLPPFETAWQKSDSYVFPYHQGEPIWNSHLMRNWKVMSFLPPFETARAQSDLFTVQCGQWEPIWNSQLLRKYKEIPVQWQIYRYLVVKNGNFTFLLTSSGQEW